MARRTRAPPICGEMAYRNLQPDYRPRGHVAQIPGQADGRAERYPIVDRHGIRDAVDNIDERCEGVERSDTRKDLEQHVLLPLVASDVVHSAHPTPLSVDEFLCPARPDPQERRRAVSGRTAGRQRQPLLSNRVVDTDLDSAEGVDYPLEILEVEEREMVRLNTREVGHGESQELRS